MIYRKKTSTSRHSYSVTGVLIFIGLFTAFILIVGTLVVKTTLVNLRYRSICPDYFASLNAFVAGPDGKGLDSISVTMRDNSNINCIYQTFTNKDGKFTLFNDFNSFALYETPFTYYVYVSAQGMQDTIRYKFRRYRNCHFEKVEGPDTIYFDQYKGRDVTLSLKNASQKKLSEISETLPFTTSALVLRVPPFLKRSITNWKTIVYGTIKVKGTNTVLAAMQGPVGTTGLNQYAVYYCIDRNFDGGLDDETPVKWRVFGGDPEPDCKIRTCFTEESIISNGTVFRILLRLRGFGTETPVFDIRSENVLCGEYIFNNKKIAVTLWDRDLSGFRNWRSTALGLDLDHNGIIDFNDGSSELFENIASYIVIDSTTIRIDTITENGLTVRGTTMPVPSVKRASVAVGDMAPPVAGYYKEEFNLFKTCSQNDIVILYFFEGDANDYISEEVLHTTIADVECRFKRVQLIGINRKVTGTPYCKVPVIDENQGWNGPIVRAFHNSKDRELVCIDSTGTIVARGIPGGESITEFFKGNVRSN